MQLSNPIDPNYLGNDISQTLSGDLAVNVHDLQTQSGSQNVIDAFVRELTTPLGYIARYVKDIDGLKIIDADYGNPAYYQLSEPVSDVWISNMLGHIQAVGSVNTRLDIQSVDYSIMDLIRNQVQFLITFKVQNDLTPIKLVLARTGDQLGAVVIGG